MDFVGKCEQHRPYEQLAELLCTLPAKFDVRKVSLKVTDKRGVLRLDRFQKIMLDRRQSMRYKDVQIIGQRERPSRSDKPGIRGDAYGLKYLFS